MRQELYLLYEWATNIVFLWRQFIRKRLTHQFKLTLWYVDHEVHLIFRVIQCWGIHNFSGNENALILVLYHTNG